MHKGSIVGACLLFAIACQQPRSAPPQQQTTPQQSDVLVGYIGVETEPAIQYFVCEADYKVFRQLPDTARVVFDFRLKSGQRNRRPTRSDSLAITSRGGKVLHMFKVSMIRAEIEVRNLPRVVRETRIDYALNVPNHLSFDVPVQVFHESPITPDDTTALKRLGVSQFGVARPNVAYGVLPDSTITTVERLPNVDFVRARAMQCESDFR